LISTPQGSQHRRISPCVDPKNKRGSSVTSMSSQP
jgi:hypothetical protein